MISLDQWDLDSKWEGGTLMINGKAYTPPKGADIQEFVKEKNLL